MHRSAPRFRVWRNLRPVGDAVAGVLAFYLAFVIRIHYPIPLTAHLLPSDRLRLFSNDWLVVLVSQVLVLYFFGFYDPPRPRPRLEILRLLLGAAVLQGLAMMGYYFLTEASFPRSVVVLFIPLNYTLLILWRLLLQRFYRIPERRVAIVGCGAAAREVAANIKRYGWHGLRVVGFVPAPGEAPDNPGGEALAELGPRLGTVGALPDLLSRGEIDDIILAATDYGWQTQLIDDLARAQHPLGSVLLLPGPFESLIGRMRYRWIHDTPLIEVVRESEWRINSPVKRLADVTLASLLLLLTFPAMLLCALAIRLTSSGPILHRQTRVGRGRRAFTMWKFRTMQTDAESESEEVLAQGGDPRLTPVGAFLRRFRLDELPQLLHVLQGTMSLVGPRPERPGFVQRYLEEVPGYTERFAISPGLTGLAQVNGDYHSSPQNKLRYDLAYIANWSLWLDLSILFRTVKIVLTSQGT